MTLKTGVLGPLKPVQAAMTRWHHWAQPVPSKFLHGAWVTLGTKWNLPRTSKDLKDKLYIYIYTHCTILYIYIYTYTYYTVIYIYIYPSSTCTKMVFKPGNFTQLNMARSGTSNCHWGSPSYFYGKQWSHQQGKDVVCIIVMLEGHDIIIVKNE